MVKLQLSIKADLENVTDLEPAADDFEFFFKASTHADYVKCTSCHEIHPNEVSINRLEERELTAGKGSTANFVWRCSNCKRESSAKFESPRPVPYTSESSGNLAPFITMDCRGLEFIGFNPKGIWQCKGAESGTVFSEVDLSDGEWTDYDEKTKEPVSIMEIESEWSRA